MNGNVPEKTPHSSKRFRRASRAKASSKASHWRRNLAVLGVLILLMGLVLGGAWQLVLPMFETPDPEVMTDYPGPGSGSVDIVIVDATPEAIAGLLANSDVVATTSAFVEAYRNNPQAHAIEPGNYSLTRQMSAADAVAALLDPATRTDRRLTFPPGWTKAQIFAKVAEVMEVPVDEVTEIAGTVELPPEANQNMEGWLFAGTYVIDKNATVADVLTDMIDRTINALDERELSADQRERLLIIASIAQAEVDDPAEQGQVARVIENRLAGCTTSGDPLLQMDSTLAYGLDKARLDLSLSDVSDESTPFNTYIYEGLPPAPINSPSIDAVDAALTPPAGDWCYFVTVNLETGQTLFTDNPAEHEDNRAQYRRWLEEWREQAVQDENTDE